MQAGLGAGLRQGRHHPVLVGLAQVSAHRQAQHPLRRAEAGRVGIGLATRRIRRLMVQGLGVVHRSRDAGGLQASLHRLALVHQHRVLGPDAIAIRPPAQQLHRRAAGLDQLAIALAQRNAAGDLPVKARQFGQHHRALQGVHAAAHAHPGVVVARALAMHPDLARRLGDCPVAGEQRTAIAIAAQGLAGEEAGAGDAAEVAALVAQPAAGPPQGGLARLGGRPGGQDRGGPEVAGAKALRRVFDHHQPVAQRDGVDGRHVGHLAVEADRHDGPRARRDRGLDQGRIDIAGIGLDIDIHRLAAQQHDHLGGGGKGEGRGDDLVTGLQGYGHQRDQQRVAATGHRHAVRRTAVGGQGRFHLGHLGPHDVLAVVQHALDAAVDVGLERGVLRPQVGELHSGHHASSVRLSPASR